MIKSIIGFLNGSVYKTNQTNKCTYLSDGTKWNSLLFHQNLNIIRSFINYEASNDEDAKIVQKEISFNKNKLKATLEKHDEMFDNEINIIVKNIQSLKAEDMYGYITANLPFGKYKGKRVCDVALIDKDYLKWFFATTSVSFDKLFNELNTSIQSLNNLKKETNELSSNTNDLPF